MTIAFASAAIIFPIACLIALAFRLRNAYVRDSRNLLQSLIADLSRADKRTIDSYERPADPAATDLPDEREEAKFEESLDRFVKRMNEARNAQVDVGSRIPSAISTM